MGSLHRIPHGGVPLKATPLCPRHPSRTPRVFAALISPAEPAGAPGTQRCPQRCPAAMSRAGSASTLRTNPPQWWRFAAREKNPLCPICRNLQTHAPCPRTERPFTASQPRARGSGSAGLRESKGEGGENEGQKAVKRAAESCSERVTPRGAAGEAKGFADGRRRAAPCGAAHSWPGARLPAARSALTASSEPHRDARASSAGAARNAALRMEERGLLPFLAAVPPGKRERMSALRSTCRRSSAAVRSARSPAVPHPAEPPGCRQRPEVRNHRITAWPGLQRSAMLIQYRPPAVCGVANQ